MQKSIKTKVLNNVMVAMSYYIDSQILTVLEQVLTKEFVNVNLEEITTLPAEVVNNIDRRNRDIIQLFIFKKKTLSGATMDSYLRAVKRLVTEINAKSLDQMETADIEWYLMQYEKRNIASGGKKNQATTMNNERRFLSAFFTWMRREKMIAENPVEAIEPRKAIRKPIDYFRPAEMAKLRDACENPRERALIEVLRSTGARNGELVEIMLEQIDWETGDILILSEKSNRYRTLYLDEDARYYLKQYMDTRKDSSPYMFPQSRAPYAKMSTGGVRSILKAIGNRAGVKCRVYPHKMRKTLGMTLKNKGVDIGTIQEIMGHASPAVTAEYYAQSTPSALRYVRERAA